MNTKYRLGIMRNRKEQNNAQSIPGPRGDYSGPAGSPGNYEPLYAGAWGNPPAFTVTAGKRKRGWRKPEREAKLIGLSGQRSSLRPAVGVRQPGPSWGRARANRKKGNHIITSSFEHHAVLDSCQHLEKNGFKVTYLPVTPGGQVRASDVAAAVTDETILISVMHVNNEVGTIQPVAEIGRLAKERGILFHSDGVQSVGKVPWMWKNCTWTVHLQRA